MYLKISSYIPAVICSITLTVLVYLRLCWIFLAVCRLSLVLESRGYSLAVVCGLLIAAVSLTAEYWSMAFRPQSLRLMGSRVLTQ